MITIVLSACLIIAASCEENSSDKKSDALIKTLRKKLTENNYDYSSTESVEIHLRAEPREIASTTATAFGHTLKFNKQYSKTLYLKDAMPEGEPRVSQADLFYYLDDRHLLPERPTVKYKVLKLKHKSRRSGGEQLIQEESKDGVAIINLGGGPFPEFRLPRSRRQYMQDHGQLISDEEDPPLHFNDSSTQLQNAEVSKSETSK